MPRSTTPVQLLLWQERFVQFSQSQQTVDRFCECHGCTPASFYYWRRKLAPAKRLDNAPASAQPSAFVPIVVRGGRSLRVLIRVNDGTQIAVPSDALGALEVALQHSQRVAL